MIKDWQHCVGKRCACLVSGHKPVCNEDRDSAPLNISIRPTLTDQTSASSSPHFPCDCAVPLSTQGKFTLRAENSLLIK